MHIYIQYSFGEGKYTYPHLFSPNSNISAVTFLSCDFILTICAVTLGANMVFLV